MDATIPIDLNSPLFIAKWQEYVEYRKERRLGKLLPRSVQKQWDYLAGFGLEVACAAIDLSIRNQWQGIFPERVQVSKQPSGVRTGFASLGALQVELQRKREELQELTNPGGCAFPVTLTGEKATKAALLREQIKLIKENMDRTSTQR